MRKFSNNSRFVACGLEHDCRFFNDCRYVRCNGKPILHLLYADNNRKDGSYCYWWSYCVSIVFYVIFTDDDRASLQVLINKSCQLNLYWSCGKTGNLCSGSRNPMPLASSSVEVRLEQTTMGLRRYWITSQRKTHRDSDWPLISAISKAPEFRLYRGEQQLSPGLQIFFFVTMTTQFHDLGNSSRSYCLWSSILITKEPLQRWEIRRLPKGHSSVVESWINS